MTKKKKTKKKEYEQMSNSELCFGSSKNALFVTHVLYIPLLPR